MQVKTLYSPTKVSHCKTCYILKNLKTVQAVFYLTGVYGIVVVRVECRHFCLLASFTCQLWC